MGLCTQKDVLYDDMTVTEHLEFIANIKGLNVIPINKNLISESHDDFIQRDMKEREKLITF